MPKQSSAKSVADIALHSAPIATRRLAALAHTTPLQAMGLWASWWSEKWWAGTMANLAIVQNVAALLLRPARLASPTMLAAISDAALAPIARKVRRNARRKSPQA